MPAAERALSHLPDKIAPAVVELLIALTSNPHRIGKPLLFQHQGRFSVRRGPYRVIYEIDNPNKEIKVIAIGHRRDIYR